jgi:L-threonine kinase
MNYSVKIYSRIGELIQGVLPDRSSFLVSGFPSGTLYSEASLEDERDHGEDRPARSELPLKTGQALSFLLEAYLEQTHPSAHPSTHPPAHPPAHPSTHPPADPLRSKAIRLHSNIPPGKGLSSSSADVLSVLCVVNDYLQAGFTPEDLYRFAARVEPTDPCLSSDIVLFKQQSGITVTTICLPPLSLLYFDAAPDRQVDTLGLQRIYPEEAPPFFDGLLRRFIQAAAEKDYSGLLDCVTRSAVYNQAILALPGFDEYYRLAADSQAGLMVAHSGTIIGLLTRPEQAHPLRQKLERMANRYHPAPVYLENYFSPSTNVYA